jgi:polyisoprenoid-binding protein YceI
MKKLFKIIIILFSISIYSYSQSFDVKATGTQTFSFVDESGRNQASFHSTTPFEEINGLTTQIDGKITFDVNDFANTLKGEFTIPVASLKTGIEKMEKDLRSSSWLDAEKFPTIIFKITKVSNVQKLQPNKLSADVTGDFTVHGVTKEITTKDTVTYLDESEMTRARMPGDLLGVISAFDIKLSEFDVEQLLLGKRVSNDISIRVSIVGSNKF